MTQENTKKITGYLYKIIAQVDGFDDSDTYYGSTTQKLSSRMATHRRDYKKGNKKVGKPIHCTSSKTFEKYGVENCVIYLVQKVEVESREELRKLEGELIKNNKCVNKVIPGRTDKEYREDNKERLAELHRNWATENKDYLQQYKSEYYQTNKEHLLNKQKEYRDAHKEQKAENDKIYYEKNKEQIQKWQRTKVECPCGGSYTLHVSGKSQHCKSRCHQQWLDSRKEIEV